MKKDVYIGNTQYSTLEKLKPAIKDAWEKNPAIYGFSKLTNTVTDLAI